MPIQTKYVYALIDPTNQNVRYVGQTDTPRDRLIGHLSVGRKAKGKHWIKDLISSGKRPEMIILETVFHPFALFRESFWINTFKSLGSDLVNIQVGIPDKDIGMHFLGAIKQFNDSCIPMKLIEPNGITLRTSTEDANEFYKNKILFDFKSVFASIEIANKTNGKSQKQTILMQEQYTTAQSNANVPYVEPTEVKGFLVKILCDKYSLFGRIEARLNPNMNFETRTLTIKATSYTAARKMVEDAGYTLA